MDGGGGGGGGGSSGGGGGGGGSEGEKKKVQEGEIKVKRKMKTASQLEILEKTYAVETYPSEALRAELSVQLGLSDRQLQMWFCHRRLKERKAPQPAKRQRKDASAPPLAGAAVGSSGGVGDEMVAGEAGIEHFSGSGSGSSPFGHLERVLPRAGTAVARIAAAEMPAMKRYYEPPQAISELRAIAFVEAQLGETLREDGPILGMEFDPLPPGAFGAPIMAVAQQKPTIRPYEAKLFEWPDAKLIKGTSRALHEYQFLPEQPSVRSDTYERAVPSHYYGSPTDVPNNRTLLSTGRSSMHGSEQVPSGYGLQGQIPSLSVLPQQGRQGHLLPSASGDHDIVPRKNAIVTVGMDAHFGAHPITGLDNPFVPSDRRVSHEDDILRMERKRKSEEARIAREVEAHEKRIRKELEKQDLLRRKREEQMRKEMERQDRERRKEEERLLREKQREEERYQREQRREMERREKFLQKESIRAEKLRLKEELRKEKEAARVKAANDRATARRIAKESMELIDDERLELMELAASSRGLPSMLSLDSETLQSLESLRDMLLEFPPKSVHLKKPFSIQPWAESEENIGHLLMVWRFLITFADVLGLWPFTLDEFIQAFHDYDPRLLGEIHVALLNSIIKDIEDVARTPATGLGPNQNSAANPGGGHPQIVEGAYAWGFDIRSWQHHLNPLTWPEILRQFALAAGYGPKLKKRSVEQAYPRDENEGNDGEGIISDLRNGAAAENALAIMQERGFSNRRKSRHRLTPGTVKFAAFHVLSLEGSSGLTILEVAEKIQRSGLRDLTTSKTPEASIAAALSRDTKLFERTAPSTYCVRAPYRKDPADGEVILSEAREKIQVFKNGYFDGEEADDVERDDAEKDEDSESDVGEDPGVDDIGIEPKLNEDVLLSSEPDRMVEKSLSGSMISHNEAMKTSQGGFGESASHLASMESGSLKELKMTGSFVEQPSDIVGIHKGVAVPAQEDTVIDESNSGEPWVQGLTEGEYSDLSVEERLQALVALIGVANEGNSIRIVLEERLEAANALKKQMWAEAQVDKRRFREEFVVKVQYPSFVGNRAEQNTSIAASEDRQSLQLPVDDKNALASIHPVVHPEHLGDPLNDSNNADDLPTERNLLQDFSAGSDNLQLQQPGYVSEKSRSQLKAFIGHKAEKMYVYRSLPLGQDRRRNRYWQFITSASRNDPGSGRIFVELRDGRWRLIDCEESFNRLLASLDVRGLREAHLHSMLQIIEVSVKETFKKNSSCTHTKSEPLIEDSVQTGALETASRPDCSSSIDSPNSTLCISNSDISECSSSFVIGLGRDETEKSDALKRYRDFEKWLWEECFNSSILCAMKYGETRCKPLLGICDYCNDLYFFEENYCPSCCRPNNLNFSEQVAQFKEKLKGEPYLFSHNRDSSPLRIRLLKAQLALIEACILDEALQPAWSEDYRRSWGMKLLIASSVEALLQVLTLLEGAIKRDFLSSNYETTNELLGSSNLTGYVNNGFVSPETVSVLPWLPQTTSSLALRLMELDTSIFYKLSQKEDAEKDKGTGDFMTPPSKYAAVKNAVEGEPLEAVYEAGNLQQEPWVDPGSGRMSSGRGRGRTRGRGCSRGGRSQRRAISQRSNTPNGDRAGQLVGWKGRARGRGGRRRGRRTIRSKQKLMKKATDNFGQREKREDIVLENSADASLQAWNVEETTGLQFTNVKIASSSERSEYENDNCPESGEEYDEDLVVDGYSNVYTGQSERFMDGVDYGVDVEEEDDRAEEEDDDDINEEDDDDEQGDVDVDGFFNGDSDENRDVAGGQIGNPDDITESSSGYSD